jgi:ribosomal protein L24E
MFSKKFLSITIAISIILTGCSTDSNLLPERKAAGVLSGREGVDGQLLAVKIDDTNMAHPQIGVEDADVVYIEQVEGGLTRLAAIFSTKIPQRIGPVRSARISDIDILSQYGRVAFAYSGAQKKLLPVIAAANLQDLGAQRQGPTIFTTDPNRTPPYAMVLRADLLMQKIKEDGLNVDTAKSVGFMFGDRPNGGEPITQVVVNWPATTYSAQWSEEQSRWLLSHNSKINLAESGVVLGPTTFVIQMVRISPSEYGDKFGGVTPLSETIGSGKAYVLRDGEVFLTTWNRAFEGSGTTFTRPDGSVMNFAPGQVWVALTDREPEFTARIVEKNK